MVIDDYLPVDSETGMPVFASCRQGEMWVSLLEKAWAKLHGDYARTEGGLPSFAATHIMGVPSESIQHNTVEDTDEFFDLLSQADRKNFIMMASSKGKGEDRAERGIIFGHAYSLISIHQLLSGQG